MPSSTYFRAFVAIGGALSLMSSADAQFVRRYAGGGVAVRAPFVRVDVGPYGETSVRAPFVAVDDPGATYVGPGQRMRMRPGYAGGYYAAPAPPAPRQMPTPEQLAALDLPQLIQELRVLDALFMYELSRFDKADGWQRYLALPGDALGSPGQPETSVRLEVLQKQLARFDKVATDPGFAKIAASPSFPATHEALRLVVERLSEGGPAMVPPQDADYSSDPGPVTDGEASEQLPPPPPNPEPARMRSGERSILKK